MIHRKPILIVIIIVFVFIRTFTESYMVQLGLNNQEFQDFYRCTIVGCFLKFKYQIFLDIFSFGIYFLLAKQYLNYDNKRCLISSGMFILVFMLTDLYEIIGSVMGTLIPDFVLQKLDWNDSLYWSIEYFIGMLISIAIMTFTVLKIKKK